jgi:hypothetical protein
MTVRWKNISCIEVREINCEGGSKAPTRAKSSKSSKSSTAILSPSNGTQKQASTYKIIQESLDT